MPEYKEEEEVDAKTGTFILVSISSSPEDDDLGF